MANRIKAIDIELQRVDSKGVAYFRLPKELRIGQHIYNQNTDLEMSYNFKEFCDGKFTEIIGRGIDIFNISDKEFISKLNRKQD